MMEKKTAFFAYPSYPPDIGQSVSKAIATFNNASSHVRIEGWEQNDISGLPLVAPIFEKINDAAFLAADITYLNENVVFEIGYAIGCKKRCLLFVNTTHVGDRALAASVGIFDTLGYEQYENFNDLSRLLRNRSNFQPLDFDVSINHQQPVYIVEPCECVTFAPK